MDAIKPQPGPQELFLSSAADIAIYGGAAGGGKSFALLMEPLRHLNESDFRAVIFRRTVKQVRNEGGLWDTASSLYGNLGGTARESTLSWRFSSGSAISFGHLEHEKNKFDWQGAQISYLGFDELTHFSQSQFFYLLSRNRSLSGSRPYVRASCNPDADSWVADFVSWWISPRTGYPRPERSGRLRWFIRHEDSLKWSGNRQQLEAKFPGQVAKSVTFVAANVEDNRILMEKDPGYKANLATLTTVDRERLLHGNWKIRPDAGVVFRRSWFPVVAAAPARRRHCIRGWDLAASRGEAGQPRDWTVGVKVSCDTRGVFYVEHVERFQGSPHEVERSLRNLAENDGPQVGVALPQDPGQAGKAQSQALARLLAGYRISTTPVTGSKYVRAKPFAGQAEAGNVLLVEGPWNEAFLAELEGFPGGLHDDQVDAVCEAFNGLTGHPRKRQQDMDA